MKPVLSNRHTPSDVPNSSYSSHSRQSKSSTPYATSSVDKKRNDPQQKSLEVRHKDIPHFSHRTVHPSMFRNSERSFTTYRPYHEKFPYTRPGSTRPYAGKFKRYTVVSRHKSYSPPPRPREPSTRRRSPSPIKKAHKLKSNDPGPSSLPDNKSVKLPLSAETLSDPMDAEILPVHNDNRRVHIDKPAPCDPKVEEGADAQPSGASDICQRCGIHAKEKDSCLSICYDRFSGGCAVENCHLKHTLVKNTKVAFQCTLDETQNILCVTKLFEDYTSDHLPAVVMVELEDGEIDTLRSYDIYMVENPTFPNVVSIGVSMLIFKRCSVV